MRTILLSRFWATVAYALVVDRSVLTNYEKQLPRQDVGHQIAFASYINPIGDPSAWTRLLNYDTNKVSVLVTNVLNGPDYVVDNDWVSVIQRAKNQNKTIIGYARTGYLGSYLADLASQIEQDVDKWYELYPNTLGGIFFEEGWPECGTNNVYADLYKHINDYTKRQHPGAYTVLNPGSTIAQCYENTMDTLLTFENSYEAYLNSFVPNNWTPKDPRKIWHIINKVPQNQIASITQLSRQRNVGYVEVTDDDQPNPYDNLPSDTCMQAALNALPGGKVRVDGPITRSGSDVPGLPNDAKVSVTDYSAITLTWSPVANALGYSVYKNGALVLELPPTSTRATIGMLDPGNSNIRFEVRTLLNPGGGGTSKIITASTLPLPGPDLISNVHFRKDGETGVVTADVLVPYAFARLFIAGQNQPNPGLAKGWPIAKGDGSQLIANYLVEGNDFCSALHRYTGAYQ